MELTPISSINSRQQNPSDWFVKELAELCDIDAGLSKPKIIFGKGFLVVTVQDLYEGEKIESSSLKRVVLTDKEAQRYRLFDGDILIGNASVKKSGIGYSNRFLGFGETVIFAKYAYRVNNFRLISSEYLHYVLRLDQTRQWIISNSQTGTLTNLNKAAAKSIPIPFPKSIEEQQSITTALSDVDSLLDSLDRLIAKKRNLKQAAMQQLLTGQTRLPGFSGEWLRTELKHLVSTPITDGPHLTPTFYETGVPFLSVNNLTNNRIDLTDLRFISRADDEIFSRKCKPRKGDVLLGKAASVGKVAIVEDDLDFNIWSPIALVRSGETLDTKFLYFQLLSADSINQVTLLTNSSSQGNIGMGDIEKIQISYPCVDEQIAISKVLTSMDMEISAIESRRNKTAALKQGMMQELLTGRTRLV